MIIQKMNGYFQSTHIKNTFIYRISQQVTAKQCSQFSKPRIFTPDLTPIDIFSVRSY